MIKKGALICSLFIVEKKEKQNDFKYGRKNSGKKPL